MAEVRVIESSPAFFRSDQCIEILKQPIHTSVAVEREDFEDFNVQEGLHIGIVVKDFRAIIAHAETTRTSVTARYSRGNRPMQITYENEGVLSEFTLMTRGHSSGVPSSTATGTPTRDLSVRPVSRNDRDQSAPSIPATTQLATSMPPPSATTLLRDMPPQPRVTKLPSRTSAPAPSASNNPDSLFMPADDEQQWDEPDFEEQTDFVGWMGTSDNPSMTDSGPRIRDSEPTSFRSMPSNREGEVREIAPTQRLSQLRGLFD